MRFWATGARGDLFVRKKGIWDGEGSAKERGQHEEKGLKPQKGERGGRKGR